MRATSLTAAMIFTILTASSPTPARADGVALLVGDAETVPDAAEQRAVLWLRDGTWELTIQPVFLRGDGAWTWIVPLPLLPTAIELGDPAFLKDLSVLTTPVTIKACQDYCCCCNETGGGSLDVGAPQSDVQIWQTGTLGDLDYTVLSSLEGASLVDWLGSEGYTLPTTVADALALYDTEDVFFFAAKLTEGIPADAPLDPVVFALDGLEEPLYPMRLTTAAIGPDPLSLILWVITPKDIAYKPGNIPAETLKSPSTNPGFRHGSVLNEGREW